MLNKPQKAAEKLEMFIRFALMDQQFSLVVYEKPATRDELMRILKAKQAAGMLELTLGKTEFSDNTDDLFNKKDGLIVFELNENNLAEAFEAVSQVRHTGVYEAGAVRFRFPDNLKLIFTVSRDLLDDQPAKMREKMLYIFSPVCRQ